MLLVLTALALVASVPLAGGRLSRLADIRLRASWAVLLAAALQVGITDVLPGGSHALHAAVHMLSYVLDAYFVFANRHLKGVAIVAPGPWPIGNVLSVGDLIIFIGAFIVLHSACGSRLARLRPSRRRARISRDARGSTAGI